MDELVQLRKDLKESNLELEKEKQNSKSLEDRLAISQSDFLKATVQIIDLRGMIATEGSDDEAEEWNPLAPLTPLSRSSPRSPLSLPLGVKTLKLHRAVKRSRRLPKAELLQALRGVGDRSPLTPSKDTRTTSVPSTPCDVTETNRRAAVQQSSKNQSASRKRQFADSEGHTEQIVPDREIISAVFDRNLSGLRARLRQGVKVRLWEDAPGCHVHSFDCLLSLDKTHEALTFLAANARRGTFSLFAQRTEVLPMRCRRPIYYSTASFWHRIFPYHPCFTPFILIIPVHIILVYDLFRLLIHRTNTYRISDMVDCLSNACTASASEQHIGLLSVFKGVGKHPPDALTIVARPSMSSSTEQSPSRIVSLKVALREDRNFLLSALRTLISISLSTSFSTSISTSVTMADRKIGGVGGVDGSREGDRSAVPLIQGHRRNNTATGSLVDSEDIRVSHSSSLYY